MLRDIGHRASNARTVMDALVDTLIEGERRIWRLNGPTGKKKWPPLRKNTLARKVTQGLDQRPMHVTGRLERSLTVKHASGMLIRMERNKLTFGTTVFY